VQPTGFRVRSVFVFLRTRRPQRRYERGTGNVHQELVEQVAWEIGPMRSKVIHILTALGSVAALALAGGASIKGF
jgi:hypothetical protein